MEVRIKLFEGGTMPIKMHETDAGFDCYARSKKTRRNDQIIYELGFAIEVPRGYVALMFPRSSVCDYDVILSNCVGVVDSGYRGEVKAVFNTRNFPECKAYEVGDRVCQMIIIPYPEIQLLQVKDLSVGERGDNGFGSTSRKPEEKVAFNLNVGYSDWKTNIINFAENTKPQEWRKGQAVFNAAESLYKDAVRKVQTDYHIDCFYDDSKIDDFLSVVYTIIAPSQPNETKKSLF